MIKILHIVSSLNSGGVEKMLYNYFLNIDKKQVSFDFIVHGESIGVLEKEFIDMGSKIYHVTPKKKSLVKNVEEINKIIKNNNYNIVHCHQNFSSFTSLYIAKKNYVPITIIHAHGYEKEKGILKKTKTKLLRYINLKYADFYFACGNDAGKWLCGDKWKKSSNCYIMNNAIDVKEFLFNEEKRKEYRKQYNVKEDEKVLIHVGRFSVEKNHRFLIQLMKRLKNAKLFLIGDGELKKSIELDIEKHNMQDRVIMLGVRKDIGELMSMSDIFLFPSINEGFGIVALEAQCSGLRVIMSENIPKDIVLTDLIDISCLDNLENWIDLINKKYKGKDRKVFFKIMEESDFNIKKASSQYIKYINKNMKGKINDNLYN